jgi:hypothetical protein
VLILELRKLVLQVPQRRLMTGSGVMSYQTCKPRLAERQEMAGAVERMESGIQDLGCVADVVQIRRRYEYVCIV